MCMYSYMHACNTYMYMYIQPSASYRIPVRCGTTSTFIDIHAVRIDQACTGRSSDTAVQLRPERYLVRRGLRFTRAVLLDLAIPSERQMCSNKASAQ